MAKRNVGFIGFGRMGGALAQGAVAGGILKPSQVFIYELDRTKKKAVQKSGFRWADSLGRLVGASDLIFLCVKPQSMSEMLDQLALESSLSLRQKKDFVSIAAGLPLQFFEKKLGPGVSVVRVMSNTPALLNAGMSAYCAGRSSTHAVEKSVAEILRSVGEVVRVTEKQMALVTAVSGSGPAYVFYLAEALTEAAQKLGFTKDLARVLARQTIFGSGLMLKKRSDEARELRAQVTSPGGTTAAATAQFDKFKLKKIMEIALRAAVKRSHELSKG